MWPSIIYGKAEGIQKLSMIINLMQGVFYSCFELTPLKHMLFSTNQNFLLSTLISSCVDESQLCKGVALCPNAEDLKFCKNATSWTFDDSEWTRNGHLDEISCNHLGSTDEENLQGQQIKKVNNNDGLVYNCINRRDEQAKSL